MPSGFTLAVIGIVVVGLAAGIIIGVVSRGSDATGGIELPDFATSATAPKGAAQAYQFALDRPDLLVQIPCYCGGAEDGRKNHLDCFLQSPYGHKVVFDPHGPG